MQKSDNVEEFKFLLSFKSRLGLIFMLSIVGLLLAVISLFLPMCSYNPTVLDEFKRSVGLFELPAYVYVSLLFLVLSVIAALGVVFALTNSSWREKKKRLVVLGVLAFVAVLIAITVLAVACVFYRIPEAKFDYLETDLEAGYYLFGIGGGIFAAAFLLYCFGLKNLADGKTSLEALELFKKN